MTGIIRCPVESFGNYLREEERSSENTITSGKSSHASDDKLLIITGFIGLSEVA